MTNYKLGSTLPTPKHYSEDRTCNGFEMIHPIKTNYDKFFSVVFIDG